MTLDISAAPEIARLAELTDLPAWPSAPGAPERDPRPRSGRPATVGYLAGCLRRLVADPQAWWGLVRFDPGHPVRVAVPAGSRCEAWLLILPPGYQGAQPAGDDDGQVACAIAGQPAVCGARGRWPLAPGRVRVRGGQRPGLMVNAGRGYAISLHASSLAGQLSPDSRRVMLSRPDSSPMPGSPVPGSVLGTPW